MLDIPQHVQQPAKLAKTQNAMGSAHLLRIRGERTYNVERAIQCYRDALAVQDAGAQMILLEAIPPQVGKYIAKTLEIPVLSIGAGMGCDGQLLIVSDMIGQFQAFTPKFVKKYANVAEVITNAMKEYCDEVRQGKFPEAQHCYNMLEGEEEKFLELVKG